MALTIKTLVIGIIPSANIHHDVMMTGQKGLALTWIKCDAFAVCE